VELIGLALGCILFASGGAALGLIFAFFRKLRPFILPAVVVPPISFLLLMLSSWWVLDRSPICGPDPEWDRCPSHFARIVQLSVWLAATGFLAAVTTYAQRGLQISWQNFVYRKQPLNVIENSKDI
jgi:hypothetical protein